MNTDHTSVKQLPVDCRGTIIGFGDQIAFAVNTYNGARLVHGRVYGMKYDENKPVGRQLLIQTECDDENGVFKTGIRDMSRIIVIEQIQVV